MSLSLRPLDRLRAAGLRGERRSGGGLRFDCSVGHSSRGTLSVREGEDGTLYLHCFAGCTPAEVLAPLGLTLADLFPERILPATPEQRRLARQAMRESDWRAALAVLEREAAVVEIAGHHLAGGLSLSADDLQRLAAAVERIADARAVLR